MEGFENVGKVMLSYYQNLWGIQHTNKSPVEMSIINQELVLSIEQQVKLCQPFTTADIKEAIHSIPTHKSPGPDGFNSGFFKHSWNEMEKDLCYSV